MKIIEALKELPLLEKRIDKNIALIGKYSSDLDRGDDTDLPFGDAKNQQKEVDALLQSTEDLIARKAFLRRALSITNANVYVEIDSMKKSITEWIEYRERGMAKLITAYQSLSDANAQQKLKHTQLDLQKGVRTLRFYDEKARNDKINEIENIRDLIDARLEMVNATTDLVEI